VRGRKTQFGPALPVSALKELWEKVIDGSERGRREVGRVLVLHTASSNAYQGLAQAHQVRPPQAPWHNTPRPVFIFLANLNVKNVSGKTGVSRRAQYVFVVVHIQLELLHLVDRSRTGFLLDVK